MQESTNSVRPDEAAAQQNAVREQLILKHLPQVHHIAQSILSRLPAHAEIDDLLGAGAIGLLDAVAKFDSSRSVKFRTYAELRIRGAILDSLREMDWAPRSLRKKGRQVEKARKELEQHNGRPATDDEIAEAMGATLDEYYRISNQIKALTAPGSIPESIGQEDDTNGEIRDDLGLTGPEMDPFFLCHKAEMRDLIARAIFRLPRKERLVVSLYYYDGLTMKEIGRILGVEESGISQLRSKALYRLRIRLKRVLGPAHFCPAVN